jgi:hypothetical protein
MPSSYSPDLRIELIATGEQSGTWGITTNSNLGTVIEDAISALASVSVTSANQALTAQNGAVDQARCAAISLTTTTSANFAVYVPPVTKLYVVTNPSGYTATVYCSTSIGNTTAAGTGVAIPTGKSVLLRADGTNVVEQLNHVVGAFSVGGTASAAAFSGPLTGNVTGNVTGNLTGNVTGNVAGNVAAGAGTIATTNFTITEVGGVLYIKHGSTNIASIDSSGNLTVIGNVTAYGTV